MSDYLLSIQIPYTYERKDDMQKLVYEFDRQIKEYDLLNDVIIQSDDTGKQMPIGQKRNILYQRSKGLFSTQWDSDDWIKEDGLKLIIDAIRKNPTIDCITYQEYCMMDGKEYKSNHSTIYDDWEGDGQKELYDGFHFHRTPFMKDVIKTEIAKAVLVPPIRFGEDHEWSKALKPYLKTEFHIPEQIYRYIHNSSDPNERYGLDNHF